jgi:hypothetical protein
VRSLEKESGNDALCHRFCVKIFSEYLTKEILEGFGDLKKEDFKYFAYLNVQITLCYLLRKKRQYRA